MFRRTLIISIVVILNFSSVINAQHLLLCNSLNDIEGDENDRNITEIKIRRVRALCDVIYPPLQTALRNDETDFIPDFDLTQIDSDDDANQILKRFRRSRFSSGGSRSGGGSRFSSGSRSSGSRFFGGSRSSSSSSSGSSRIFGRTSSSSSSSSSSGSRIFSRSSSSSSSGTSGHRVREAIRSAVHKPSSSVSSNTGSGHRVRQSLRTMFRRSASAKPSGIPSASGGLAGTGTSKPGLSDKIRQITHSGGYGGGTFGGGSSSFGSGFGGSSGTGGNSWVRAGKTFLPHAVRFGKRYYQRRKYSKGMYAGAGYYAGSHMGRPYGAHDRYGYPPVVENPPEIKGKTPTVFYCIQEDLNTTLVNQTLNAEGFGTCNISGKLVECPIEIECQTSEADNCCEDEQGTPFCCGGPIPEEYASQYGGYEDDDMYDAAESLNNMLNIMTVMSVLFATICFTMWHRRDQ